ncbi:M28 family peptidase [Desmospora profundinema]|uniref:Aminopeptidase YwaD n=1 Tax=Desmospora profundinema TaxID=1571184 RepID=A0ABU1IN95_9BACL|nr:M28 family peptidase [Desmospora profundinema]MDR6226012.1 aminopeptidase YwaD [Desmospora profundinema]
MRNRFNLLLLSAVLALGGVFAGFSSPVSEAASVSSQDKKITARFDSARALEHIRHLSVDLGPRVTGTEQEEEASRYMERLFKRYGYKVSTQKFSIPDRLEGTLTLPSDGNRELAIRIATGSAPTGDEGLRAPLVDAGLGGESDFPDDTAGKVALIRRGEYTFYDKARNAEEAGASGVILYDHADALVPPSPSLGGNDVSIPVVAVTKKDGEALLEAMQSDDVTVSLFIQALGNQTSQNVMAIKKPKGKKGKDADIVYVTAHYDSVPYSPGANDNASGTGVLLELARIMKGLPTEKEVRFVAFGAEEIGLVGSRYYVSQLSSDEIRRSAANFNMDMVGTNWDQATQLYVNVVDGQPNLVWQYAQAAAERLGNDTLFLYQRGSSDHVAFYEAGIDAANFIRREPETANLEPWYHTPEDTIDKIDQERLQEAGELVGSAVYDLTGKETPRRKKKKERRMVSSHHLHEDHEHEVMR